MPEGDTILRTARTLHRALAGRVVVGFDTAYAHLSHVNDDHPIAGRTVVEVRAVGKHLLISFSGDLTLRTHMRMSGSWHIYRPGERWQRAPSSMRILIANEEFMAVAFNVHDARFYAARELDRSGVLTSLGPDLLSAGFDATEALARMRARPEAEVAEVVLDQRVVAGAGNVFKSEALFVARINPFLPVADLDDARLQGLIDAMRSLMAANVTPTSGDAVVTSFGFRRTTRRSSPDQRLWVYNRAGEPCRRCGTPIASRKQGPHARMTFWCPTCQPGAHDRGARDRRPTR